MRVLAIGIEHALIDPIARPHDGDARKHRWAARRRDQDQSSIVACHSETSCSAGGSLVMQLPASRRVTSRRPHSHGIECKPEGGLSQYQVSVRGEAVHIRASRSKLIKMVQIFLRFGADRETSHGAGVPRAAKTAAPNEIQLNGVGGLRTYLSFTHIGDHTTERRKSNDQHENTKCSDNSFRRRCYTGVRSRRGPARAGKPPS
jgi:hypothetical protein